MKNNKNSSKPVIMVQRIKLYVLLATSIPKNDMLSFSSVTAERLLVVSSSFLFSRFNGFYMSGNGAIQFIDLFIEGIDGIQHVLP